MNMKLFFGLNDRLTKLLDEHVDIFFRERPWLEKPKLIKKVKGEEIVIADDEPHTKLDLSKERDQNELETKKVLEALQKLIHPEATSDPVIQEMFGNNISY